ncbi:MAG: SDR family NAD(P)-dependent oxidoreductase, partial [Anaerolineales bacterium]
MTDQPLLDKIAIVTGASSGIGRASALALARQGAHIALAARRIELLDQVIGDGGHHPASPD